MNLTVKDVFVQDVLQGMADNFGVSLFVKNNLSRIDLPPEVGSGFVSSCQFASGIGFIQTSYTLHEDLNFTLENNLIHPLKIIFNTGDVFYHKFDKEEDYKAIERFKGVIVANSDQEQHQFKIPSGKSIEIFSIEINRKLFEHKISDFVYDIDRELNKIFRDVNGINSFYGNFIFPLECYDQIKSLTNYEKEGFFASLHREGVSYFLLNDALQSFLDHSEKIKDLTLNDQDVKQIIAISQFLETNLNEYENIPQLEKKFNLPSSKIQKGFRAYYNCSVNDFVQRKRLETAKKMLDEDYNISEIAYKVGLNSKSYFSKLFRDRYGVAPSEYKKSRISGIRHY